MKWRSRGFSQDFIYYFSPHGKYLSGNVLLEEFSFTKLSPLY